MKNRYSKLAALGLGTLPLLFMYQNCNSDYSLTGSGPVAAADQQTVSTGSSNSPSTDPSSNPAGTNPSNNPAGSTPVTTMPVPNPNPSPAATPPGATATTTDPGKTVCNPFTSGAGTTTSTAGSGLVANGVFYLTSTQSSSSVTNYSSLVSTAAGLLPVQLVMSEVNVPNVYFSQGFTAANGDPLKAKDGSTLDAFFGFTLQGSLVLGDWAPGDYQIAVLSDDGSNLSIKNAVANADGSTSTFTINNDGAHSMKMGCSSQIVHLTAGASLPLTFQYYQGPPTTIGLMILARPVPQGNTQDPLCGDGGGNDGYFFNDRVYPKPSVPEQPYLDLVSRGWQPIDSSHYMLPTSSTGVTTACMTPTPAPTPGPGQ